MARKEDTERRAAWLRVRVNKSASLLDDAVDGGKPEACSLADLFGGEKRLENLLDDLRRNARPAVAHLDQHIVGLRHAFVGKLLAFLGGNIVRAQRKLAAVRHGIAGIDRQIHDHLLELRNVDPYRPQVAAMDDLQRYLFADEPF